jgi:hypothetical protein|nr:MAG TPA: hypothetical protein [Caudoviricetes sp.]
MLVLKDLLPLMRENDVRLLDSDGNEICLLRKDHTQEILSEKYLNMVVDSIYNEEEISDTVNISLKNMED